MKIALIIFGAIIVIVVAATIADDWKKGQENDYD